MGIVLAILILLMIFMSDVIAFIAMVGLLILGMFEFILKLFERSSDVPYRITESDMQQAYQNYANSHTTLNNKDGLVSVTPMEYSYDDFKNKCSRNTKFYNKYR